MLVYGAYKGKQNSDELFTWAEGQQDQETVSPFLTVKKWKYGNQQSLMQYLYNTLCTTQRTIPKSNQDQTSLF